MVACDSPDGDSSGSVEVGVLLDSGVSVRSDGDSSSDDNSRHPPVTQIPPKTARSRRRVRDRSVIIAIHRHDGMNIGPGREVVLS